MLNKLPFQLAFGSARDLAILLLEVKSGLAISNESVVKPLIVIALHCLLFYCMCCLFGLEVCTGFKLKPVPGPNPKSFDTARTDPTRPVTFTARNPTQTRNRSLTTYYVLQDTVFQDYMQPTVNK